MSLTFSWSAVEGAAGYSAQLQDSSGVGTELTVTGATVTFDALRAETSYRFRVAALSEDEALNSGYTEWLDCRTGEGAVALGFASGDGTAENPYLIETPGQLALMAQKVNEAGEGFVKANYALGADIDLAGREWTPIGAGLGNADLDLATENGFAGTFDGRGFTVRNLSIDVETDEAVSVCGLFGLGLDGCTISRVKVEGVVKAVNTAPGGGSATQLVAAGGILGCGLGAQLAECTFSGSVEVSFAADKTGGGASGGIVGKLTGNLENCAATVPEDGRVACTAAYPQAGAMAGYVSAGLITSCRAEVAGEVIADCADFGTAVVSPAAIAGGLVGGSFGGSIGACQVRIDGTVKAECLQTQPDDYGMAFTGGIAGSYGADMLGNNTVTVAGSVSARAVNSAIAGGVIGNQSNAGYGANGLEADISGAICAETTGSGMSDAAYAGGVYGKCSFQMGDLSDSEAEISGSVRAESTVFACVGGVVGSSTTVTRCWTLLGQNGTLAAKAAEVDAVCGGVTGIVASGNVVASYAVLEGGLAADSAAGMASVGGIVGTLSGNMQRAKTAVGCYALLDCGVTAQGPAASNVGAIVGMNNRFGRVNTGYWWSGTDAFAGHSGTEGASEDLRMAGRDEPSLRSAAEAMNAVLAEGYNSVYAYDASLERLTVAKIE